MSTKTFKTNIHCSSCLAKITPFLDRAAGENNWDVDVQSPDKVLTVKGGDVNPTSVISELGKAGYKAEPVN